MPEAATRPQLPMQRSCPMHPPEEYAKLRESAPIVKVDLPGGRTAWVITRHEQVRQLLTDPRVSSDRRKPGFPFIVPIIQNRQDISPSLIGMDPPVHTEHRRSVISEFTVKRMHALRPRIQAIVDSCIDEMLAAQGPVDLVQTLSLPVPSLVICELLGVPYAEHDFFQRRTSILVHRKSTPEQRRIAMNELAGYLDELVTGKEANPTDDDLIGRMIRKQRESGSYHHDDLVSLARLLLIAGHETTANMISLSTVALLENPDQLAALRANASLLPQAVEELLRYFSIVDTAASRTALEDIEIDGVLIRKGEGVITLGASANWDEQVFEHPERLDIRRGGRHHVAFGYGPHQCLGQNLARLELEIVLHTLFDRIPGLRLAVPVEELPFKDDFAIYGVLELPVTC